jgi:hypothetical protein
MSFPIMATTIHAAKVVDVATYTVEFFPKFRNVFRTSFIFRETMKCFATNITFSFIPNAICALDDDVDHLNENIFYYAED